MINDASRKTQEEDTGRNDAGMKDAWKNDRKTSLTIFLPLTLLQGFERVVEGLHVRGCWRLNINFIFWPHCYDRHVVSFLFSWCWGQLHQGFSEGPLGRVWPSRPHLVSTVWKSAGNCFGGFPCAPSVGCGFPYHIWSLLSGIRLATASGVSEVPLGRVWPSLPHLVSNPLGVCWQLLWHPKLNWVK